ncbi:hypothetical protein [Ktedonobacter sp. SOSP1-85]|uniref:hypothetical protein n=1 Tax=Ktedonobacter sp. SOSP1-85 TaxID=2778367 RepID=UPI001915CC79|nr:hypothetical protein [Ktedonobacter sp. SOSP1-85]
METRELSCGLCFGKVAITSFVVLHPCLGDEHLPIGQRSHHIGQVVMGVAFKGVANGKWGRVSGGAIDRLPQIEGLCRHERKLTTRG